MDYTNFAFAPILGFDLTHQNAIHINLSVYNKMLQSIDSSDLDAFGQYINQYISSNKVKVALGGYLEERDLYAQHALFDENPTEKRCIHLGIDIWSAARTALFSPLDAIVHSFCYNEGDGNYGGTIILHHYHNNHDFYTLYGHLSIDSLNDLYEGKKIEKGALFARLGYPSENGNWVPHLHFQLIQDMGQYKGDYIGVCTKKQTQKIAKNCPNPKHLLSHCSQLLNSL